MDSNRGAIQHTWFRACGIAWLALLAACSEPSGSGEPKAASEPASSVPVPTDKTVASEKAVEAEAAATGACDSPPAPAFPTAQAALSAFAEATNEDRWCDAIGTYQQASRPLVAMTALRTFALLAGAGNPQQQAYAEQFREFCAEHGFRYGEPMELGMLTANLMAAAGGVNDDLEASLAEARTLLNARPVPLYEAMMERFAAVDAAGLVRFKPSAPNPDVTGSTAAAQLPTQDGRQLQVLLEKSEQGWGLVVRP